MFKLRITLTCGISHFIISLVLCMTNQKFKRCGLQFKPLNFILDLSVIWTSIIFRLDLIFLREIGTRTPTKYQKFIFV